MHSSDNNANARTNHFTSLFSVLILVQNTYISYLCYIQKKSALDALSFSSF